MLLPLHLGYASYLWSAESQNGSQASHPRVHNCIISPCPECVFQLQLGTHKWEGCLYVEGDRVGEGMAAGRAEEVVVGAGWRSRSLGEPPGHSGGPVGAASLVDGRSALRW